MTDILIATHNRGKLVEIQAILQKSLPALAIGRLRLVLPADLGLSLDVEEDGFTYAENAAKKAQAFWQASGLVTLADDSGLEVDALHGEPGIRSARYAPQPGASDADRRAYLLKRLRGRPRPWPAHFHCTVAVAHRDGTILFAEGDCPGEIIETERGNNGFGYDPIFYLPEWNQTMAELPSEVKNQISHRAVALRNALPLLEEAIS